MSSTNSVVDELNRLSNETIGAAIEVHRNLGPGLLESAYESCLSWELRQLTLNFNVLLMRSGIKRIVNQL